MHSPKKHITIYHNISKITIYQNDSQSLIVCTTFTIHDLHHSGFNALFRLHNIVSSPQSFLHSITARALHAAYTTPALQASRRSLHAAYTTRALQALHAVFNLHAVYQCILQSSRSLSTLQRFSGSSFTPVSSTQSPPGRSQHKNRCRLHAQPSHLHAAIFTSPHSKHYKYKVAAEDYNLEWYIIYILSDCRILRLIYQSSTHLYHWTGKQREERLEFPKNIQQLLVKISDSMSHEPSKLLRGRWDGCRGCRRFNGGLASKLSISIEKGHYAEKIRVSSTAKGGRSHLKARLSILHKYICKHKLQHNVDLCSKSHPTRREPTEIRDNSLMKTQ